MCNLRLIALVIVLVFPGLISVSAASERPNFIVMIGDDISWDDYGAYGHPSIRTPHVDALAKGGMRFDLAFLTTSSCSPSRCSILTGRYPHSTGAGELHQSLPADQLTFAKVLKDSGYYTAAAGKWHLGNEPKSHFDVIRGGGPSGCEHWVASLKNRDKDKPFFLFVCYHEPHDPIASDHRFTKLYSEHCCGFAFERMWGSVWEQLLKRKTRGGASIR